MYYKYSKKYNIRDTYSDMFIPQTIDYNSKQRHCSSIYLGSSDKYASEYELSHNDEDCRQFLLDHYEPSFENLTNSKKAHIK